MSRREDEFWQGPYAIRPHFALPTEAPELTHLAQVSSEVRLTLVGACHQLAPGVELVEVGGHTPAQMIVVVRGAGASAVLTSDAIHSYEEFERGRPSRSGPMSPRCTSRSTGSATSPRNRAPESSLATTRAS